MKQVERVVLVLVPLIIIGGLYGIYHQIHENRAAIQVAVDEGVYERPIGSTPADDATEQAADWRAIYPSTVPMMVGGTAVQASVADSLPERIKGLSGTPYLPAAVVKLFAFGVPGEHSIWMKDMNYPLDIIWANETGVIVHIEEDVSPETYPESFSSPEPAWFVVETAAGFVASNTVAVGDRITIPTP